MTYAERTLDYLWAIAPDGAGNADIARRLGTTSQTVYMLMQGLFQRGLVRGQRQGRSWVFYAGERRVLAAVDSADQVRACRDSGGSSVMRRMA